jgi:ATP-binding cassette subfamily A (ABC1) protein 3
MGWWLESVRHTTKASRYGALLLHTQHPSPAEPLPAGAEALVGYWVVHNTTAYHAVPVFINVVNDALLKWTTGNPDAQINVRSAPFPFTSQQSHNIRYPRVHVGRERGSPLCHGSANANMRIAGRCMHVCACVCWCRSAALSFTAVLFVIIAFSFIPASFAVFVVKEREINAKHQQVGEVLGGVGRGGMARVSGPGCVSAPGCFLTFPRLPLCRPVPHAFPCAADFGCEHPSVLAVHVGVRHY